MMGRLGVFGGMFDPVHRGHVEAAAFALSLLQLNHLKMIPCHLPNHREAASSDAEHRMRMLELALEEDAGAELKHPIVTGRIEIDPIELNRPSISYMVETLSELQSAEKETSLVLVLGADSFNTIPQWHQWQELFDLCHILVLARTGWTVSSAVAEQLELNRRSVDSPSELFRCASGQVYMANEFNFSASSTLVREKLKSKQDLSSLMHDNVIDYISDQHLYRE